MSISLSSAYTSLKELYHQRGLLYNGLLQKFDLVKVENIKLKSELERLNNILLKQGDKIIVSETTGNEYVLRVKYIEQKKQKEHFINLYHKEKAKNENH